MFIWLRIKLQVFHRSEGVYRAANTGGPAVQYVRVEHVIILGSVSAIFRPIQPADNVLL